MLAINEGTRGRLEGCDVAENKLAGLEVADGAYVTALSCKCVGGGQPQLWDPRGCKR